MPDQGLVSLYERICRERFLSPTERRHLWFAMASEIERVMAQFDDPERASDEEIRIACARTGIPALPALVTRARQSPPPRRVRVSRTEPEPWSDDPREVLALYWKTIGDLVTHSRIRLHADLEQADTVESRVKEKLFRNDCEIVRAFRHESSFVAYLNTIVHRTFADLHVERFGKWHYSTRAQASGPLAMELERMVYREGYSPSEAISSMLTSHPEMSKNDFEMMFAELPVRQRRSSKVSLAEIETEPSSPDVDILMITGARLKLSEEVAAVIRRFMEGLEEGDRLLLQFVFEANIKVSTIARLLKRDQKLLYRRRNDLLRQVREELFKAGITRDDAADLYGYLSDNLDFGLGKRRS